MEDKKLIIEKLFKRFETFPPKRDDLNLLDRLNDDRDKRTQERIYQLEHELRLRQDREQINKCKDEMKNKTFDINWHLRCDMRFASESDKLEMDKLVEKYIYELYELN